MSEIAFSYSGQEFTISTPLSGHVKLYAVPEDYSDDGLYLATWANGEIEPIPACAIGNAVMLAHLKIEQEGSSCKKIYIAEGVKYAQK